VADHGPNLAANDDDRQHGIVERVEPALPRAVTQSEAG